MQNRSDLKHWLQSRMRQTGWSADRWAKQAKIAPSTVTRFLKHDDAPMMSLTTINKLTDALPENIDYGDEDDDAIYSTQHAAVPRWDYRASAGQGIQIQEGPEERDCLLFQRDWLEGIASNGIDKLFALTIEGNSMAPTLLDGDTILVDRAQTKPRGDGIYLLNVDGELLVKRLQRSMADGTWTIISDNQLYPSEHGITPDLLDIEGRVRWIGRKI